MEKTIILIIILGVALISSNLIWYEMSKSTTYDMGDFVFEIKEPSSEKYLDFYHTFEKNGPPMAVFINGEFNFPPAKRDKYFIGAFTKSSYRII